MGSLRLAILASIRDAHEGPQPPQSPGKVDRKRKKEETARALNGTESHSPGARGRKKKLREADDHNDGVKVKEEKVTERRPSIEQTRPPAPPPEPPTTTTTPAKETNGVAALVVEKGEKEDVPKASVSTTPPPPPQKPAEPWQPPTENDEAAPVPVPPPPPPPPLAPALLPPPTEEKAALPLVEEVVVKKGETAVVSSEPSPSAEDDAEIAPPASPRREPSSCGQEKDATNDVLPPPPPKSAVKLQKQLSTASSMSDLPALGEDGKASSQTTTTPVKKKRKRKSGEVAGATGERRPGRAAAKEATRRILNRQYATEEERALQNAASGGFARCERCRKRRQLPPSLKLSDLPERWYCEMNSWNLAEASCDAPEKKSKTGRSTPSSAKSLSRQQSLAEDSVLVEENDLEGFSAAAAAAAAARRTAALDAASLPGGNGPILSSLTSPPSSTTTPLLLPTNGAKEESAPLYEWAQCDRCQKWRRLPGVVDVSKLPEKWYCEMNKWDSLRQTCEAPEEVEDDDAVAQQQQQQQVATAQANLNGSSSSSSRKGVSTPSKNGEGHHRGRPPGGGGRSGGGGKKGKQALSHQHSASSAATVEDVSEKASSAGGGAGKRAKPVWNWVQCERKTCRKWRRLPPDVSPESLPDRWLCSMNTWDTRFASCAADEEDVEEIEDESAGPTVAPLPKNRFAKKENKLSYRELIFTAEGKLRPPFSERSSVTSIFSVGTRLVNGKLHDVEAYADSEYYDPRGRDYNVYNATTGRSANKGLLS